MTPRLEVERTLKEYRIWFDKSTGDVRGLASGGGAVFNGLSGDALILATFSMADPETGAEIDPTTVWGCVECYYQPLHRRFPATVDLATIAEYQDAARRFRQDRSDPWLFLAMQTCRDHCITYREPKVDRLGQELVALTRMIA